MKSIEVSTDVFAKIWSLREASEETEDEILRRVLFLKHLSQSSELTSVNLASSGLLETRFGVRFEEAFEIFRKYKGTEYRAKVVNGQWEIAGLSGRFSSLNELSRAIGTKVENAWQNWLYINSDGKAVAVSELRDPANISRRKNERDGDSKLTSIGNVRWCDDVRKALLQLGGEATLSEIYKRVRDIRGREQRSLPESTEAIVRKELEMRSSDSEAFDIDRGEDWFEIREGKGAGVWGLRSPNP